jgi:hypothetical protein
MCKEVGNICALLKSLVIFRLLLNSASISYTLKHNDTATKSHMKIHVVWTHALPVPTTRNPPCAGEPPDSVSAVSAAKQGSSGFGAEPQQAVVPEARVLKLVYNMKTQLF